MKKVLGSPNKKLTTVILQSEFGLKYYEICVESAVNTPIFEQIGKR